MNRYDNLIHDFLLANKAVSLEKVGDFTVTGEPFVSDANTFTSVPKIDFVYNKKAETTPALIDYIADNLRKPKPLVAADIESYLIETKQWINISKSYMLEGLGELVLDNNNQLSFKQQVRSAAKEEESRRRYKAERAESQAGSRSQKRGGVFALAVIIILLILAGAGWGVYSMFFSKGKTVDTDNALPSVTPDSAVTSPPLHDTLPRADSAIQPDSVSLKPAAGTARYKFIYDVTLNRQSAVTRTEALLAAGSNAAFDSLVNGTAIRYRLYIDTTIQLSDTSRVRDSLGARLKTRIMMRKF
ncbi:hypothetical protein [Foetidibacter luteolus]|uniref:hypothetical protein n=1 Tax=Foetidibacter luteolus TaxID=2608880 RepID=UPI00129B9642|nr:hypothetical protein [Foetidibacter luteolus]